MQTGIKRRKEVLIENEFNPWAEKEIQNLKEFASQNNLRIASVKSLKEQAFVGQKIVIVLKLNVSPPFEIPAA